MAISPQLRNKLIKASAGGAITIAVALLSGTGGLEGYSHTAYKDQGGIWTVCDAHTGKDIIPGKYYTDEECGAFLEKDISSVRKEVDKDVKVPIGNYMRASMYSFAYNVGITSFRNSSLLRHLNAGNMTQACNDLRSWVYVNDQRNRGLINRREIENTVCMMDVKK